MYGFSQVKYMEINETFVFEKMIWKEDKRWR